MKVNKKKLNVNFAHYFNWLIKCLNFLMNKFLKTVEAL